MSLVKPLAAALVAVPVFLLAGSTANVHGNGFGNPSAPVVIEVFSDFQCPGCKALHDYDLHRIVADYVVPGKVYLIYRYFPIPAHRYGRLCAQYACAAAHIGRYQKVADALFAEQAAILSGGNAEAVANSVLIGRGGDCEVAADVSGCAKRNRHRYPGSSSCSGDIDTYFLGDREWQKPGVPGLQSYALFKQYIDGILPK